MLKKDTDCMFCFNFHGTIFILFLGKTDIATVTVQVNLLHDPQSPAS